MTYNTFVDLMTGQLPGEYSTFNYGSTEPAAEDQDKPWLKLDADLSPWGWMVYYAGAWRNAQRHPLSPGHISHYFGLSTDIPTLDDPDGDGTNPFWLVCDGTSGTPDLSSRFIVGAGSGAGLTTYALSATGGSETHTLTAAEIPAHSHELLVDQQDTSGGSQANTMYSGLDSGATEDGLSRTTENNTGGGGAHENRPPYYALWTIMRSTRLY
jgi:microcystin-dependent protein